MAYSRKQTLAIASPIFVSLIAQNIIGVTDTAFMGRLGDVALGGTAMASMVYFCIFTLGFGLGAGTQIIIARRHGSGLNREIGNVMVQSLLMLVACAIFLLFFGLIFGKAIFALLLSSEHVVGVAGEYWNYRIWGYLFAFICVIFRAFFVGIEQTKVLTYNSVVMAVVNIVLDYGLIFGKLGLPELGVKGAAIASVLAELSSLIFFCIYFYNRVPLNKFGLHLSLFKRVDWRQIKMVWNLSVYIMMQALVSMGVWAIFFVMIEKLGERPLAIATIARSVYIMLYIPISSYGTAVNTTVSHLIGGGEDESVKPYLRMVAKLSFGTMAVLCGIVCLVPHLVLRVFSDDPILIRDTIPSIYVICIALVVSAIGNMYFSAVSASGATKCALYIESYTIFGYLGYAALMIFVLQAPVHICFTVEALYYIFIGLQSYTFISQMKWQDKRWSKLV